LRFGASLLFASFNASFWVSTLMVNGLGTLLYFASLKVPAAQSEMMSFFIRFGVLGALTTFSTLSFEVASAFRSGQFVTAGLIFGLNILTGVLIAIGMLR
jgi:fluoride ion exporter CrcB/FEX